MVMRLAAVADDLTGAHDLAGRLARAGSPAWVARRPEALDGLAGPRVLNAETRFLSPVAARVAVQAAWSRLGPAQLHFQKMDSTLRGNPREETEGLLLATAAPWVAFVPAYPAMGRVTRKGVTYVHGQALAKSEYARDPLTPARAGGPQELLLGLPSAHVPAAVIRRGQGVLVAWLRRARSQGARFIGFDCASDADLVTIARASLRSGCRHFSGASGLAGALADLAGSAPKVSAPGLPWTVLAGSVSASSFAQLIAARKAGLPWAPRLQRQGKTWRCEQALPPGWSRAPLLALSSLAGREDLGPWLGRTTREDRPALAERSLRALVAWGLRLAGDPGRRAWALTGGHTLSVFYDVLGVSRAQVLGPLLPGLPLVRAFRQQGPPLWLATKPGGFGSEDLYVQLGALRP